MSLSLIPTGQLLEELFARMDSFIFVGAQKVTDHKTDYFHQFKATDYRDAEQLLSFIGHEVDAEYFVECEDDE